MSIFVRKHLLIYYGRYKPRASPEGHLFEQGLSFHQKEEKGQKKESNINSA